MAAPKFSKNNVEQTIDLKEMFGVSFKGRPLLREALGQAILDKIRDRSDDGRGISFDKSGNGRPVKLKTPYSKAYTNSLDFKAFGKSKNKVNMELTGDMLGLMDVKRQTSDTITIGWDERDENNKAFNHATGDTVPRRPFFGCSKSELKTIGKQFKSEIKEALKVQQEEGKRAFNSFASALIERLRGES